MYAVNNKRIIKNTVFLYVRMLVVMCVGIFTSRILLHNLGIENFGLYNVVGAVVAMLTFVNGILSQAGMRYITLSLGTGDRNLLQKTFSAMVNVQYGLAVLTVAVLLLLGQWILSSQINVPLERMDAVRFAFYCVVAMTALGLIVVPYSAAIVAYERMDAFAWMSILDVVAKLGISYAIAITPFDKLESYAVLMLATQVVSVLVNIAYCRWSFADIRYRLTLDWRLLMDIYSFAGWSLITAVALVMLNQGFTLINQKYFGAELVAAFAIASTVQGHVMSFINNFKMAANPQITKAFSSGDETASTQLIIESTLLAVVMFFALAGPVFVYADRLLALWLFEVPDWACAFLRIGLVASMVSLVDTSLYMALYLRGKLVANVISNIIVASVVFALSYFLVVKYGHPCTVSLAMALFYAMQCFIFKPIIVHYTAGYGMREYRQIFVPFLLSLLVTAMVGAVFYFLTPQGLFALLSMGALSCIATLAACWYCAVPAAIRARAVTMLSEKYPAIRWSVLK